MTGMFSTTGSLLYDFDELYSVDGLMEFNKLMPVGLGLFLLEIKIDGMVTIPEIELVKIRNMIKIEKVWYHVFPVFIGQLILQKRLLSSGRNTNCQIIGQIPCSRLLTSFLLTQAN
jgi:hypothetical protein